MAKGDIYYSNKAKRFYQEGRSGAVSTDVGARSLTYDPATEKFIDSRGQTIEREILAPNTRTAQRFTAMDLERRTFLAREVKSRIITEEEALLTKVKGNEQIQVRTVVTTPDGKTHVFYRGFGTGKNVDPEEAKSLAAKSARGALLKVEDGQGNPVYQVTTNQVKSASVRQDFYKQSVGAKVGI